MFSHSPARVPKRVRQAQTNYRVCNKYLALIFTKKIKATIVQFDCLPHTRNMRASEYFFLACQSARLRKIAGYPTGHTTIPGSISKVLSFLFPRDKAIFMELAKKCSASLFEEWIHFRAYNEVELEEGKQLGQQVISVFLE